MRLRMFCAVLVTLCTLAGSGCKRGQAPSASSGLPPAAADEIRLVFSYGSEKQKWVDDVAAAFNASGAHTASGKHITVQTLPKGSGELVDDILAGRDRADLASPASAVFIRLGNARARAATGRDFIGNTQSLLLSPVVIAMWKPMAEAIGWGKRPIGWADILALARERKGWAAYGYPQWGAFKFGHTHPAYSNSGIIALIAENYAATGKVRGLTPADVDAPKTRQFVGGIEDSIVHYGSSTGFFGRKLFDGGPAFLSAAVLYESMVVESAAQPGLAFPVVAIYPREGTFWSDHPVGIVDRDWVTPERRAAAQAFIDYLLARPQQEKALTYGFRPGAADLPVAAPIDSAHGVDPGQPATTLEIPPPDVVAALERQWEADEKKPADIDLVLDTSGSMKEDGKLTNAKAGARQLVSLLGGRDQFSLLSFSNAATWASKDERLAASRTASNAGVESLFASGQTALYDAVGEAYTHLQGRPPGHIRAMIVLTDGDDNVSKTPLPALLDRIRAGGEDRSIRIFTIAYGSDAQRGVLGQIASVTQGKAYDGTPANIVEVFRDLSTFF